MTVSRHALLIIGLAMAAWGQPSTSAAPSGSEAVVRKFYEAFNAHDPALMSERATDDVKWMSVKEAAITVDASGLTNLKSAMEQYFRGVPTVQSNIESLIAAGPYVTVHERVTWKTQSGEKTQACLAVYEVRDGKVARAWYFPVVR